MSSNDGSDRDHQKPPQFTTLLNHLFETRLGPHGRPYTLTEVGKTTGMSVPYLSHLRKGTIRAVSFQRVEALARFFHVTLDYFSQKGPPVDTVDELVRDALAKPLVREVILCAGKAGTAQRALVLQMLDRTDHMLAESVSPPALPPAHSKPLRNRRKPAQ